MSVVLYSAILIMAWVKSSDTGHTSCVAKGMRTIVVTSGCQGTVVTESTSSATVTGTYGSAWEQIESGVGRATRAGIGTATPRAARSATGKLAGQTPGEVKEPNAEAQGNSAV